MGKFKVYKEGFYIYLLIALSAYIWGYWNEKGRIHALTTRKVSA